MRTAYILKAHVESDGTVRVDEKAPLAPGPAEVLVRPREEKPLVTSLRNKSQKWKKLLQEIDAVKCSRVPDDGLSIDEIVYGYKTPKKRKRRGK